MWSNSECCQTDRGYYTVLLRQRLKSTKNGCVHMTVCSSLAYSRPHCHHALALDSVRWHCAHVQLCPPCSTIHHPVTEYKTFSVALLTMQHPAPPPSSPFSPPALQESGCHSMFPVTTLLIPSSPVSPNLPLSIHLKHEPVSALQQFNWNWSWLHLVKFRLTGKWWEGLVYMSVWDELIWLQKELVA